MLRVNEQLSHALVAMADLVVGQHFRGGANPILTDIEEKERRSSRHEENSTSEEDDADVVQQNTTACCNHKLGRKSRNK